MEPQLEEDYFALRARLRAEEDTTQFIEQCRRRAEERWRSGDVEGYSLELGRLDGFIAATRSMKWMQHSAEAVAKSACDQANQALADLRDNMIKALSIKQAEGK